MRECILKVDIHSHILHGIDDGPETLEQSMEFCTKLKQHGIESIIATPHFISGDTYMPAVEDIREKVSFLQKEIDKKKIGLKIFPGMEVFASHDTVEKIRNNEILSLNDSKYILIEFPLKAVPRYASDLLFAIQLEGYTPIIAHPERYCSDYRKSKLLSQLVDKGALLQINSASIAGAHGKKAKKAAEQLLGEGMVHLVASDAHGEHRMPSDKWEIEKKISRICGVENTERIMHINPQKVLENEEVLAMSTVKKSLIVTGFLRKIRLNL
jgi:protein-tyrosine phosphatase